ncbi:hypothetical protein CSUI_009724 [Cystoisospora suis]|uniref:Uncharacterized protein n=1 Tax=Cystoisospora suis TaxID=483139 RepID=A0A2C6KIY8_9APIC|nr:hypothetical protein CSUI_009724 [Cystoisospora suis]
MYYEARENFERVGKDVILQHKSTGALARTAVTRGRTRAGRARMRRTGGRRWSVHAASKRGSSGNSSGGTGSRRRQLSARWRIRTRDSVQPRKGAGNGGKQDGSQRGTKGAHKGEPTCWKRDQSRRTYNTRCHVPKPGEPLGEVEWNVPGAKDSPDASNTV